jgi:hypothetical protein
VDDFVTRCLKRIKHLPVNRRGMVFCDASEVTEGFETEKCYCFDHENNTLLLETIGKTEGWGWAKP